MSSRTHQMSELYEEAKRFLAPLTVGFDSIFEDAAALIHNTTGYPPYNVVRRNGETLIQVALAGFAAIDLQVYIEGSFLHIKYDKSVDVIKEEVAETENFAHRGIATRSFDLTLKVAEGVLIAKATMKNGLLQVSLVKQEPAVKRVTVDITEG